MTRRTIVAVGLAFGLAAALAQPALSHPHGAPGAGPGPGAGPHVGGIGPGMMGQGMMGSGMMGPGMMGRGAMPLTGPMGPHGGFGPMGAMAPAMEAFDTDGDGRVDPREARAGLSGWLERYDADGDGMLSIQEYETLHTAVIRPHMVDRFQALDADGDGRVSEDEMTAPAARMERMERLRETMPGVGAGPGMGMPGRPMPRGSGPMMNDN